MVVKLSPRAEAQDARFAELLTDAVRLLRRDFYARAHGLKLTPALARLLFHIDRHSGCAQVELAARIEVTPVTLGRMIDRLVKCGYVRRMPDPTDRRIARVFVDQGGKPLVVKLAALGELTSARALNGIGRNERAALARQLRRICSNLSNKVP